MGLPPTGTQPAHSAVRTRDQAPQAIHTQRILRLQRPYHQCRQRRQINHLHRPNHLPPFRNRPLPRHHCPRRRKCPHPRQHRDHRPE